MQNNNKNPLIKNPTLNVDQIVKRIKEVMNVRTDIDLSVSISVSKKTVSSWRRRNSIPLSIILLVSSMTDSSTDYLLTGTDGRFRQGAQHEGEYNATQA